MRANTPVAIQAKDGLRNSFETPAVLSVVAVPASIVVVCPELIALPDKLSIANAKSRAE